MSGRHNAKDTNKKITEYLNAEEPVKNQRISIFLGSIKEELDEHMDALNANTDEIQSTFEYVNELEAKIDKLNEKIEQIQLFLGMQQQKEYKYKDIKLNFKEQELFLILYTAEESMSLEELSRQSGFMVSDVKQHVKMMRCKGIPLLKKETTGRTLFLLEPEFKHIQAKENILELGERVMSQLN